jgi:hypothetical protein
MGLGRKRYDSRAQLCQEHFVSLVLLLCPPQVDGLALDERKLTMNDGRAHGAGDGGQHKEASSLHENVAAHLGRRLFYEQR